MDPMIQALIDYGVAGVFLAYLIWSRAKDQTRADALQNRYEEKLETLRITNGDDQEKIRDRYRDVVEKYDSQIRSYGEERQKQIAVYADERAESRRKNTELRLQLDKTLNEIKTEVSENGKSIARMQTQIEGLTVRLQAS